MKIKAIIFDLDNTLIDFIKMKKEACKAAVKAMIKKGLKLSFKKAYKRLMETYFNVGIESDKAFEKFLESQGFLSEKILAAGINAYLEKKQKFLKPYPKVKATLKKLRKLGLKLVIVTDAPKLKAYQRVLGLGIDEYFDFLIGKEDTGKEKASLEPLKLALRKLELEPEEVLLVGDSIERDIKPAKKLGIKTVLAKYGQERKEKGKADFEIKSIDEVLKIVS
ncbi:MAG: TIGR02253 family HAD-type hydrolase [Candidatus Aenigmarchaeota archaeon]|nr:TIGR02253 family HAD-type hydrolase [Candidatus Aenigmarchaeota archaeon]